MDSSEKRNRERKKRERRAEKEAKRVARKEQAKLDRERPAMTVEFPPEGEPAPASGPADALHPEPEP